MGGRRGGFFGLPVHFAVVRALRISLDRLGFLAGLELFARQGVLVGTDFAGNNDDDAAATGLARSLLDRRIFMSLTERNYLLLL